MGVDERAPTEAHFYLAPLPLLLELYSSTVYRKQGITRAYNTISETCLLRDAPGGVKSSLHERRSPRQRNLSTTRSTCTTGSFET